MSTSKDTSAPEPSTSKDTSAPEPSTYKDTELPEHWIKSAQLIVRLDRDPATREEARRLAVMLVKVLLANTPTSADHGANGQISTTPKEG
jgi:hypothetical protein